MTPRLSDTHKELYRRALDQQAELIGWGFRQGASLYKWQERSPLSAYVDTNTALWNTRHDQRDILNPSCLSGRKGCAVINYYHSSDVAARTKQLTGTPALPPMPLQHLLRELRPEPATKRTASDIIEKIDPLLQQDSKPTAALQKLLASYDWTDFVSDALPLIPARKTKKKSIVLACNSLHTGGAERQIINCAIGFKKEGWQTQFLATMNDIRTPHYFQALKDERIPVSFALGETPLTDKAYLKSFLSGLTPEVRAVLWHLPLEVTAQIVSAMVYLDKVKPRLIIAYLDWSSLIAAFAGLLTGVPDIILSGRGHAPTRFPHFFENVIPVFYDLYQILLKCHSVRFTNNALNARDDYARWLGIDSQRIDYIPNALTPQFLKKPSFASKEKCRQLYAIRKGEKVILGVFRLAQEKRPDKFLDILHTLLKTDSKTRGIICGDGILKDSLLKQAKKLGIKARLTFAGTTNDIRELMSVSDILLHTCPTEGMPNVMLEAQAQQLPVVCIRSGGVEDCLAPELFPYSVTTEDWEGLAKTVRLLLKKPALRQQVGQAARAFVKKNFSIDKLVQRNLALLQKGTK